MSVILFNAKLLALSPIKTSSAPIGVSFNVCPFISTDGVTAIGLPAPSNPITCDDVPVRYVSTPVQSVINALFAVSPVRVQPIVLSLVVIAVVFAHIAVVSASRATLIDPDIDPRVNI